MRKLISAILRGGDTRTSGLIALGVVALIALGCSCGKDLGLGNTETSNTTKTTSNSFSDNTTTSPDKPPVTRSDASKGEVPADDELQELVKATLLDFDSAVQKADFTDFHSHICKPWQKQTSPDSLKTSFQGFIDKGITIKSISSQTASFSPAPVIGREVGFKTLKLEGKYPTSPNLTKFELNYIPEGKDWKLSKIVVDTTEKSY